jgi:DNA polymerase III epsilon subunit family exonuclease
MAIRRPAGAAKQVLVGASKPLPRTFCALDLETTGFDRENDRIIEIGAVRFTEGEPVAIFNTLVNPERELSAEMEQMAGHTNADLQKGLIEEDAMRMLESFIARSTVVGHNVIFDYEFIHRTYVRYEINSPVNDLIDTLTISRDRYPYPHKLPDMCKKLGIELVGWHSAYFDALACGELLLALQKEKSVADYINVIGWKRQYGEPTWAPDWVTLKPQGNVIVNESPKANTCKK